MNGPTVALVACLHLAAFLVVVMVGRGLMTSWLLQDLENLHHPENHSSRRAAGQALVLVAIMVLQFGILMSAVYLLSRTP